MSSRVSDFNAPWNILIENFLDRNDNFSSILINFEYLSLNYYFINFSFHAYNKMHCVKFWSSTQLLVLYDLFNVITYLICDDPFFIVVRLFLMWVSFCQMIIFMDAYQVCWLVCNSCVHGISLQSFIPLYFQKTLSLGGTLYCYIYILNCIPQFPLLSNPKWEGLAKFCCSRIMELF